MSISGSVYFFTKRYSANAKDNSIRDISGTSISRQKYTWDEISKHRSVKNGVWVTLGENVYDITTFVEKHPGGIYMFIDVFIEYFHIMFKLIGVGKEGFKTNSIKGEIEFHKFLQSELQSARVNSTKYYPKIFCSKYAGVLSGVAFNIGSHSGFFLVFWFFEIPCKLEICLLCLLFSAKLKKNCGCHMVILGFVA